MDESQPTIGLTNQLSGIEEVIKEFLVESNEGLDSFDRDLVALEQDKSSRELLDNIFRAIHTIKGTGGVLGFEKLVSISHLGESVLSKMRDGILLLSPEIATVLLAMADALRQILNRISAEGQEGDAEFPELLARLSQVLDGSLQPPAVTVEQANNLQVDPGKLPAFEHHDSSSNTIRVDVGLLDKVMNLVGELVLARNQVLQFTGSREDSGFLSTAQRLNLITTELQEGVMKTRMQPIGKVWNKLPRIVRDLSLLCGKRVEIQMEGSETELDKTIIEAIKDPLTHIIRNAVDHGIEMPEVREAAGKSREGHLQLRAFHEGGQVNIEISDDGAGICVDKIKAKAIAKGIITPEHAARMSERETLNLVFAAGLSTAEQVSNISGRGVGMDVVKTNIEKIGGTVDLQSCIGKGTLLKIKIPLTLAIIPALVVSSGGERFAIPQVSLVELVRCEGEGGHCIEEIHSASVYRLRGNLLPLVYLNRELELTASRERGESANIVVLQAGDRQFGLVVDDINDTEEIVVKPLSKQLKTVSCFAGATIMGDGHVALILDVLGLAQMAKVVSELREKNLAEHGAKAIETSEVQESWLLFRVGTDGRMAIPLSLVSRLEEFPISMLEHSSGRAVVQYRGQIMPLIDLAQIFGRETAADNGLLQVIVYSGNGRSVGLIVGEILDIVDQEVAVQHIYDAGALQGTAVIHQQVTDLLDVPKLLAEQRLDGREAVA